MNMGFWTQVGKEEKLECTPDSEFSTLLLHYGVKAYHILKYCAWKALMFHIFQLYILSYNYSWLPGFDIFTYL